LLEQRVGATVAIAGTAIAFGLAHGLVEGLPILIAFGLGLAWLRRRVESTIPGMILHGTFNAIALVLALTT
jgi:membrane protease YdiL (CAAX protease family)